MAFENLSMEEVTIDKSKFYHKFTYHRLSPIDTEDLLARYLLNKEKLFVTKIHKDAHIFKSSKNGLVFEKGIPDFWYRKKGVIGFVESKTVLDGLSKRQLDWIRNHPQYHVRVIFMKIIGR